MNAESDTKTKFYLKRLTSNTTTILVLVIILLFILLSILSQFFFQISNMKNIATQITIYGLLAIGMTFVILTGGIDLSVGSMLAFCGVVLAICIKAGIPLFFSLVICILTGVLSGSVNGILVSWGRVPPFIATLGTLGIIRGLALVITKGSAITGLGKDLLVIGGGEIGGLVPVPFVITLACFAIGYYILKFTRMGRYIYTIGGNAEAARLSGVKVNYYRYSAYVISGITAAIASIVMTGRLNSAQPIAAEGYELDAIAAVILGGTSMAGGQGSLIGTFLGAVIMTIARNGMNILNVHTYWQKVVIGSIIILAVMFDVLRHKKD